MRYISTNEKYTKKETELIYAFINNLIRKLNDKQTEHNLSSLYSLELSVYLSNLIDGDFLNNINCEKCMKYIQINKLYFISISQAKNKTISEMYNKYGINQNNQEIFLNKEQNENYGKFLYENIIDYFWDLKNIEKIDIFFKITAFMYIHDEYKNDLYQKLKNFYIMEKENLTDNQYLFQLLNFEKFLIKRTSSTNFILTNEGEEILNLLDHKSAEKDTKVKGKVYASLKLDLYKRIWYDNDDCDNLNVLNKYLNKNNIIEKLIETDNGYKIKIKEFKSLYLWYWDIKELFENNEYFQFLNDDINYYLNIKNDINLTKIECKNILIKIINDTTELPQKNMEIYKSEVNNIIREVVLLKKIKNKEELKTRKKI